MMEQMRCSKCQTMFDSKDAPPSQRHKASYYCRPCLKAMRKVSYWNNVDLKREYARSKQRETRLARVYGMTEADYVNLFDAQDGKCAICEIAADRLVIDHDHITGNVRALLCDNCNRGIGLLKDHPEVVQKAADYLRKFSVTETSV